MTTTTATATTTTAAPAAAAWLLVCRFLVASLCYGQALRLLLLLRRECIKLDAAVHHAASGWVQGEWFRLADHDQIKPERTFLKVVSLS